MKKLLRAADLFCGAGGSTTGAEQSGRVKVVYAVNHWMTAIQTHRQNHPDVHHVCARIDQIDPWREVPDIDLLIASPECTGHSIARGGRPTTDQKRATGWDVVRWTEAKRPKWVVVENVREWIDWGPIGKNGKPLKSRKGETFKAWVVALESLGYRVEWRLLNAADFGEATKRVRLFVIARRGTSQKPIAWPEPTHLKANWRPAHEIIDWSIPAPSIFGRKQPLAPKTIRRIMIGLRKFCGPAADPFIVKMRGTSNASSIHEPTPAQTAGGKHQAVAVPFQFQSTGRGAGRSNGVNEPVPTIIAARNGHGVMMPFIVGYHGGTDPNRDGTERQHSLFQPLPTIDTEPRFALATPFLADVNHGGDDGRTHSVNDPLRSVTTKRGEGLAVPFLVPHFNEREGQTPRTHSIDAPLPTVTPRGAGNLVVPFFLGRQGFYRAHEDHPPKSISEPLPVITANHGPGNLVLPFLTSYFSNGKPQSVEEPLSTLTTKGRHGLALVELMQELGIVDIGFRMLAEEELARAQGFPDGYSFHGNKADTIRMIGNAVCPGVMKAICSAIAAA